MIYLLHYLVVAASKDLFCSSIFVTSTFTTVVNMVLLYEDSSFAASTGHASELRIEDPLHFCDIITW